ncbi:type II secretion system protein GspM [Marimonas arenosa]|uniref:Type II secretion system protein GspM n=1 Tax=Marimonas arenosa TaxID=1795305 RepID=A0AAE3WDC1_9RHOB|nr:type II secretion system protein GspM [Marimonas arenosa]MDQ2090851.1 type II secretion system protein GspM [Marimonas arenosa]
MSGFTRILNRLLALILLAGVAAVLLFAVVLPLLDWRRDTQDELAHTRDMVNRLQRSSTSRDDYEAQIEALAQKIGESDLYIRGETEPLAAAAIQEHIKAIIASHGGGLRSMQSLESEEEGDVIRIRVRIVMNSSHVEFVNVLHALETSAPYLFVDALEVATSAGGRGALKNGGETKLAVDLVVYGYLLPEVSG